MTFLREYAATDAAGRTRLTRRWLAERPRALFGELQREQPIFITPGFALVTRYVDVVEVLGRNDVFLAHALEARRQPLIGGFSLDEHESPRAALEAGLLRVLVRPDDAALVGAAAREAAAAAMTIARDEGGFDLVADIGHGVAGRIAAAYVGVGGPDEVTLARWVGALARDIEDNPEDDPAIHHAARAALAELGGYTDVLIASRRSRAAIGAPVGDDLLGRLIALQPVDNLRLDDRRIRELLLGTLIALVEPIAAAITFAIAELLDRPEALGLARSVASADDDPGLWGILREALRFNPPRQTIARICGQAYTLAKGTDNEIVLRPGTLVLAATAAAAFDPERVDDPDHFRLGRPAHHDFLFGHGPHACIGRHLGAIAVREGCKAVLLAGDMRQVGPLQREGNRPIGLPIELP